MLSTITFDERDGGTLVMVRWSPLDATAVEWTAFATGHESMRGGWSGTFDPLADYLATKSGGGAS